ncbi:phage tail family protein [Staphylococcus saprophyticus]|nr:phage tail family protein [Staphylococcus saprophyticus]
MTKTVQMFNDNFNYTLTDIKNLQFLDYDEEGVEVQANTIERKGKDGVGIGPSNFGPFNLILRFVYQGTDTMDYNLLKQKLRGLLFKRDPYYIVHSDMPGKKYAVYCTENAITDVFSKAGTFEIKFVVYKGYSESLKDTLSVDFLSDEWQFGNGLITDMNISYKKNTKRFMIYNGSVDTIDPQQDHKLIIKIKADAPNGLTVYNYHTNDVFKYYGSLKHSDTLTLYGEHPFVNGKRAGVDTNFNWLTLAEGKNNIEIDGNGVSNVYAEFQFNFIYR